MTSPFERSLRAERIASSPRFNGRVFVNTHPVGAGLRDDVDRPTLRDFLCGGVRRVPSGALPIVNPLPIWATRPESGLRVTWLGHSTLLIEIDGVRVLTDPVWGQRVSPLKFAGPKRFHPAPASLAALPPLDAVLVSHDHYDHLDRPTIRALAKTSVPFITSLGVGAHLERFGVPPARITELDWWEQTAVRDVVVTAAPSQHFSGRGIRNRNTTAWSSMHLQGRRIRSFSAPTAASPMSISRLRDGLARSTWSRSRLAHGIRRGGTFTWDPRMHWQHTRCSGAVSCCRYTGARLISPCIHGTSRRRRSRGWRRRAVRRW